jgi:hypothetical protein
MILKSCAVIASLALILTSLGHAAVIQIQSDVADYEAIKTVSSGALSTSNGVGGDNRIGSRTTTTLASSVLGFELPAVAPDDITNATLTVTFEGESASLRVEPGDGNIDLYGLPFESGGFTQLAARHFSGPNDATAGVAKLQDNLFTVAEYPAESTSVTKVSVDVGSYLQSLYAGGGAPGDFAVLRLSYDIDALSGNNRYRMVTSGGDGGTVDSAPHTIAEGAPHLTITVIPEPSCLALIAAAGMAVAVRRRQRR